MILVDLEFPALGQIYQFRLDECMSVNLTIDEVLSIIAQKEHSDFEENRKSWILCSKTGQRVLCGTMSLKEQGIRTADSLILV